MEALQRKYKRALQALTLVLFTNSALSGPYVELGLGVPLFPDQGYITDLYGIVGVGYKHEIDELITLDAGLIHRSLTGTDECGITQCSGDNAVEVKIIWEWK